MQNQIASFRAALDARPVSRYQWLLLLLLALLLVTDGYDAQVLGYVVPALAQDSNPVAPVVKPAPMFLTAPKTAPHLRNPPSRLLKSTRLMVLIWIGSTPQYPAFPVTPMPPMIAIISARWSRHYAPHLARAMN